MMSFNDLSDFRSLSFCQKGEAWKDGLSEPFGAVSFVSLPLFPKSPLPELSQIVKQTSKSDNLAFPVQTLHHPIWGIDADNFIAQSTERQ